MWEQDCNENRNLCELCTWEVAIRSYPRPIIMVAHIEPEFSELFVSRRLYKLLPVQPDFCKIDHGPFMYIYVIVRIRLQNELTLWNDLALKGIIMSLCDPYSLFVTEACVNVQPNLT